MKVLTVTDVNTSLSKMYQVGATILPYNLCQEISKKENVEMHLLVNNDLGVSEISNVKIINLGNPPPRTSAKFLYDKLLEIIDSYDIIHIHISTPGFVKYMMLFSKEVQKKIVYTLHTWTESVAVGYFYKDAFTQLVTDSEINLVFLTKVQSERLLKVLGLSEFYCESRIHYIHNAVNESIEFVSMDEKKDQVISVCRMVQSKGVDKLVQACIETNQKLILISPKWKCSRKEQEYCNKVYDLIKTAPEGLIDLRDEGVPHEEVMNLIRESRLGVLYSFFESFSLFLLECLSKNTPIIAYKAVANLEVSELLKDTGGVTIFNSYKNLVNLIKSYQNDYNNFSCDNSKIIENCKYENFVNNYYELYNNILEGVSS